MTDAESKVKKYRIRHCYSRKEVYHRVKPNINNNK